MTCGQCGHDNPAEAGFCMKCGNKLAAPPCTSCGAEIPAGAAFCMKCGTKVGDAPPPEVEAAQSAPAKSSGEEVEQYIPKELLAKLQAARKSGGMRGERRTVTILFCDVQGSTAAAEQLDPEEWADIMNGAFEHLIAPVYRYEGMLARLMGDAILAFFGAPISHEDDPERAVLAGLAIVNEIGSFQERTKAKWGIDVNVRVGINTGLVVVGEVGTDMRLEYTAMGDEVNLASRMESTAAPGTVQMSESTHKLVAPLFETEALGAVEVKGKSEPVNTFRALRTKLEPGRLRGIDGIDAPMIGRERELGAARGQVEQLRRGAGQALGVLAEAGLGKSRLIAELRNSLRAEDVLQELSWLEARSVSYETSVPYAPFARMLRGLFQLEGLSPSEQYEAVKVGVTAVAEDQIEALAPYLARLAGVDVAAEHLDRVMYLSPPDLRAKTDEALVDFVERLAMRKPTVLVLEDLHWADPTSVDLAKKLLPVTDRAGLMLVALLRPRRTEAAWEFHEEAGREYAHRYASLQLSPLDGEDSRALIENLLRIDGMSDALRDLISERAEGNPYFVEELVRSLLDGGLLVQEGGGFRLTADVESISVPTTLHGVLNTRLDQLDETSRRVAQSSAVLGREFSFDMIASVYEPLADVEKSLSELMRRGFVRETARLPSRQLSFKHALLRDAAYESLLLKTRRELHKQAAEVMVKIAPSQSAQIAHHFIMARENDLALPHLVTAGVAAQQRYANSEAIELLSQAIDIAEAIDASDAGRTAFEAMGDVRKLIGDGPGARENYERMLAFAEKQGDGSMKSSAHNKLGFVYTLLFGDFAAGAAQLKLGEETAVAASCQVGLAEVSMIQCNICTVQARFDDAKHYLEQAVRVGEESDAIEPKLYGMTHISNTLVFMTEMESARPQVEKTLALAIDAGNEQYIADLKSFALPFTKLANRDVAGAIEALDEALQISERIGAAAAQANASWLRGMIAMLCGDFEDALHHNERAIESARRSGFTWLETAALCTMGTTYLQVSQRLSKKALDLHEEAFGQMQHPLNRVLAAANWCELGFCALNVGKVDAAHKMFADALKEKTTMMFICEPHLHIGLVFTNLTKGDFEAAGRHAKDARASADKRGLRQYEPLVALAEAQLALAQKDPKTALERFLHTADVAEQMGFLPLIWQGEAAAAAILDEDDPVRAATLREQARAHIDTIASRFQTEELRQTFLSDASRRLEAAGDTGLIAT